jgi:hypothetical protein
MALLHDNAYEYGFIEKLGVIERPMQKFGNCTLESHLGAVEGILFIELINLGIPEEKALSLSKAFYNEWHHFHTDFQLDRFLAAPVALEAKALIDVFVEIRKKKGTPDYSEHEHHQLQKITQALVSPGYIKEFKAWVKESEKVVNIEGYRSLFKEFGVDITKLSTYGDKKEPNLLHKIIDFIGLKDTEDHQLSKHMAEKEDSSHKAQLPEPHLEAIKPEIVAHVAKVDMDVHVPVAMAIEAH